MNIYSPFCSTKPTNASSLPTPTIPTVLRRQLCMYSGTPYDVQQVNCTRKAINIKHDQTTQSTFIITQGTQPTFVFLDCYFSVLLSSIILNYFSSRLTNKAL
jgi:hypothetical protein